MDKKIKNIVDNFKRTVWILAEKSFLISVFLILLSICVGGIIYYKYYILAIRSEPQAAETSLKLNIQAYQDTIKEWGEREKMFNGANLKNYPNPFWVPSIPQNNATP